MSPPTPAARSFATALSPFVTFSMQAESHAAVEAVRSRSDTARDAPPAVPAVRADAAGRARISARRRSSRDRRLLRALRQRRHDVRAAGSEGSPRAQGSLPRPVASEFTVAPGTLEAGVPATFSFRVDGRARKVRVRIELARDGRAMAKRLRLGYVRTGRLHEHVWTPGRGRPRRRRLRRHAEGVRRRRPLAAAHREGVGALARHGHRSRRRHRPLIAGVFPVAGAYSFGGAESVFGAGREGHVHQGQDITRRRGHAAGRAARRRP